MKFYCDKCQTKYSIADEKVRGKVLKVRCKNCSHVITVREPVNPVVAEATMETSSGTSGRVLENRGQNGANPADGALSGAAARARARLSSMSNAPAASAQPGASSVSWHYAINGESFGPFTFEHLRGQFASSRLTDAAYVWNESFEAWKPVGEVAEFATALESGKVVRPPQNTIGVSDGFQAIKIEDLRTSSKPGLQSDSRQDKASALSETTVDIRKDLASGSGKKQRGKLSALLGETTLKDPTPNAEEFPTLVESKLQVHGFDADRVEGAEDRGEQETPQRAVSSVVAAEQRHRESASDRLQRLRQRLKSDESSAVEKTQEAEFALGDTEKLEPQGELEEKTIDAISVAAASAAASEVTLKDPVFSPKQPEKHAGLFAGFDETTLRDEETSFGGVSDSEAEDFFGGDEELEDSEESADAIPFVSTAPKLSSSRGYERPAEEGYSGSLLIELDKLEKQRRSKIVWIGGAAVALLVIVGGIIAWISSIDTPERSTEVAVQKEAQREIVFRRYSKEEQGRIRNLIEIPDEVVEDSVAAGAAANVAAKAPGGQIVIETPPKLVKNVPSVAAPVKVASNDNPFEAAMQGARSHSSTDTKTGVQRNEGIVTAGLKAAPSSSGKTTEADDDKFKALAGLQMPSGDSPIYQPSDALKNRGKRGAQDSGGLTDAQASAGFQNVRQSIGLCRERTMQRGLKLDTQKIYVTLEIQPTGKVSSYTVEPASVQGSEFDRCMVSHTSRWKFASYSGEPTLIKAPFILQ